MNDYAGFLRGINVGGRRIAMADLAACVESAGVRDVGTVLATGNILFAAELAPDAARELLETAIGERFGFAARLFVKTLPEVGELVAACPFDRSAEYQGHPAHTYVTFTSGPDVVHAALARLRALEPDALERDALERAAGRDDVVYWQTPKGTTLENPLARILAGARLKEHHTTRNLNTLEKVLAARSR
ncbi:DUF1697 domain-containing protein [Zhihengliuella sp.]|uniref:DUF1697 domain-containing protein n=1 Tax=Zhihengliuella sp. TaxID=1954483 RepID=UPI0028116A6B|nr:DUF1697 domain-containing protein [Zhihengliuella sp.]